MYGELGSVSIQLSQIVNSRIYPLPEYGTLSLLAHTVNTSVLVRDNMDFLIEAQLPAGRTAAHINQMFRAEALLCWVNIDGLEVFSCVIRKGMVLKALNGSGRFTILDTLKDAGLQAQRGLRFGELNFGTPADEDFQSNKNLGTIRVTFRHADFVRTSHRASDTRGFTLHSGNISQACMVGNRADFYVKFGRVVPNATASSDDPVEVWTTRTTQPIILYEFFYMGMEKMMGNGPNGMLNVGPQFQTDDLMLRLQAALGGQNAGNGTNNAAAPPAYSTNANTRTHPGAGASSWQESIALAFPPAAARVAANNNNNNINHGNTAPSATTSAFKNPFASDPAAISSSAMTPAAIASSASGPVATNPIIPASMTTPPLVFPKPTEAELTALIAGARIGAAAPHADLHRAVPKNFSPNIPQERTDQSTQTVSKFKAAAEARAVLSAALADEDAQKQKDKEAAAKNTTTTKAKRGLSDEDHGSAGTKKQKTMAAVEVKDEPQY